MQYAFVFEDWKLFLMLPEINALLIDFIVCLKLAVRIIIVAVLRTLCIFAPFMFFQTYGYFNICLGRLLEELRPWCKSRLPLFYNFIQSHYWYDHFYINDFEAYNFFFELAIIFSIEKPSIVLVVFSNWLNISLKL